MPITSSAKKADRSSKRKKVFNLRRKNAMQETVKDYNKLVAAGKIEEAKKLAPKVQQVIDKATKRGVIKKNTASRKKAKLLKKVSK